MTEVNQTNDNVLQPQSEAVLATQKSESNELAINEGINRTVDAIVDLAMTKISDKKERQLVQSDIADILRDSLHDLVDSKVELPKLQTAAPAFQTLNTPPIGNAAQAGIDVAKEVQNLGFVEFTTGLINGTFDAIIGSTIKQMEAYADLVTNLAKTLKEFESENVSQAQVTAHLIERYPEPGNNSQTVVRQGYNFPGIDANNNPDNLPEKTAEEQFQEVVDALIAETQKLQNIPGSGPLTLTDLGITNGTTPTSFDEKQIQLIRQKISESLAQSMINHLREMAREGMARIVITDGEILSKLTFKVTSTEADRIAKSRYVREQGSAYVRARAGWGWGRASVGGNYSKLDVKAVNESSFDSLTMSTEIIGQVKLRFRTETFAPVES